MGVQGCLAGLGEAEAIECTKRELKDQDTKDKACCGVYLTVHRTGCIGVGSDDDGRPRPRRWSQLCRRWHRGRMNGAELAGGLLTALGKLDMEPYLWDADAYPHCPTLGISGQPLCFRFLQHHAQTQKAEAIKVIEQQLSELQGDEARLSVHRCPSHRVHRRRLG